MNQPSASNMKRAAAMTLLPAIILVTLSTFVFTAGAACPNVPTMKMDDVCDELPIPEWTHVCWVTLKSSVPKIAELTEYVIMAARHAHLRYEGTLLSVKEMLTAGWRLPGKEREAYTYCRDQYVEALGLMASFDNQLHRCNFTQIPKERKAYTYCKDKYIEARSLTASFLHQLSRCDFSHISKGEPFESCVDKLNASHLESAPLFTNVTDDWNLGMVVFELGNMLIGK